MKRHLRFAILISVLLHALMVVLILLKATTPPRDFPQTLIEFNETSAAIQKGRESLHSPNAGKAASNLVVKSSAKQNYFGKSAQRDVSVPVAPGRVGLTSTSYDFAVRTDLARREKWSRSAEVIPEKNGSGVRSSTSFPDPYANLEERGEGWSRAVQFANAMDLKFTADNFGFFEVLHRKLDNALIYPEDFAKQRLRGKFRIEAELARDGQLIRFKASRANNDVLEAFLLVFLVQVLKDPISERFWLTTERAVVAFEFEFRTRVMGAGPTTMMSGVQKNHLLFAREALVDTKLNEKVHEILTHYIPPIVPLPGGFYVDLVLAYEFIRNLKENTPTESQARQSRIESLHQTLKQAIKGREG